jgi:hypothetical protein
MGLRWRGKGTTTTGEAPMAWCSSWRGGKMETWLSGMKSDQY